MPLLPPELMEILILSSKSIDKHIVFIVLPEDTVKELSVTTDCIVAEAGELPHICPMPSVINKMTVVNHLKLDKKLKCFIFILFFSYLCYVQ